MTSNPHFNSKTTGTEAAHALGASIKDRNVIITGVSPKSIGASTALATASQAPKNLILASRTISKLDAVAEDIAVQYPSVTVHKVPLDLSSLESIKTAVAQIDLLVDHVDVLINNAGICQMRRDEVTTPGYTVVDLTFFTNHLGPFLLTHLLLPKLRAAASLSKSTKGDTRIVNISSHGHQISPVRFYDYSIHHHIYDGVPESQRPPKGIPDAFLHTVDGYPAFIGYAQSKTANILHATELSRRLRKRGGGGGDGDDGIVALSAHPGTIVTNISQGLDEASVRVAQNFVPESDWKTLDQGAATSVVAAFDPALGKLDVGREVVGYLVNCQLADDSVAEHAKDRSNAEKLYEESERMLGVLTGL